MNTPIEIISPCLLHLGFVWHKQQVCELGVALQLPLIQFTAKPAPLLDVSGARAQVSLSVAEFFLHKHHLPLEGEIEIESAIPAHMGLGSDAMQSASMVCALSHDLDLTTSFRMSLAECALRKGGLLLTDDDGRLQERVEMPTVPEDDAWAFALVLPDAPDEIDDDFEMQRCNVLRKAVAEIRTAMDVNALFAAVRERDFKGFAAMLANIHATNEAAFAQAGAPRTPSPQMQEILGLMHDNGAAFCAQTLTGLGLYALVQGREASRTLRNALTQHVGYFGPLVITTICDNVGVAIKVIG